MQLEAIRSVPADAVQPDITDAEAAALARTTVNLFRAWRLSDSEARTLLGDMPARTWARWKEGEVGRIGKDLRTRMAHLMGVHKGLRYLFKDPARGYAWIRKDNAAFEGASALGIMLRGEISDLALMRGWLDAERSGW